MNIHAARQPSLVFLRTATTCLRTESCSGSRRAFNSTACSVRGLRPESGIRQNIPKESQPPKTYSKQSEKQKPTQTDPAFMIVDQTVLYKEDLITHKEDSARFVLKHS